MAEEEKPDLAASLSLLLLSAKKQKLMSLQCVCFRAGVLELVEPADSHGCHPAPLPRRARCLTRVGDDEHLLRQLLAGKLVLKKPKLNTCSTRNFLTKTLAAALELLSFTLTKSTAYHHKAIKTKLGTEHFGCG